MRNDKNNKGSGYYSDEELDEFKTPERESDMSLQNTPNTSDSLGSIGFSKVAISDDNRRNGAINNKFLEEIEKEYSQESSKPKAFPGSDYKPEKRTFEDKVDIPSQLEQRNSKRTKSSNHEPESSTENPKAKKIRQGTQEIGGL